MPGWSAFVRATAVIVATSLLTASPPDLPARADRPAIQLQANDRLIRQDLASARVAAKAIGGPVAIEGLTTQTDSAFANADGTVTWEHRFRPVRVRKQGGWVAADATLEIQRDGRVMPKAAAVGLVFSGGGDERMVDLSFDGRTVVMGSPVGPLPKPFLAGSTLTYRSVLPGVDLQLRADVDGFTQVLVVRDAVAASNPRLAELTFPIIGEGLTARADAHGNLRVENDTGRRVFQGATPQMWDSSGLAEILEDGVGQSSSVRGAPRFALMTPTAGRAGLTIRPDRALLTDPDTRWPVYIDPGFTVNRSSWTYVNSATPTTSYWNSADEAKVGTESSTSGIHYSYFSVGLGSAPITGSRIFSSTFSIQQTANSACTFRPFGKVTPEVPLPIIPDRIQLWSTTAITSSTTWNNPPTWGTLQSFRSACPLGVRQFDATPVTQAAAEGGPSNLTLGLRAVPDSYRADWIRFSNNPTLSVVYLPPASGCTAGVESDFTGDGVRDVAISDPEAVVGGKPQAGAVYVIDGGSGAVATLTQDLAEVPDNAEAGAGFGHALAVADLNLDGCSDLVVGAPRRNIGSVEDAGVVYLLLGSPQGLAKGPDSVTFQQGLNGVPEAPGAYDWFGFAVAAGKTAAGKPFLIVGAPGEDRGLANAGTAHYLYGSGANVLVNRETAGVPGTQVQDGQFGYSVTASPYHFAVGAPGDAVGIGAFAGAVQVFRHDLTAGEPTFVAELHQDVSGVSDSAEKRDLFGRSVSMAPYRPVGAPVGQPDSLLVVGVPGEDLTSAEDSGMVHRFHLTATGFTELPPVSQDTAGVSGNSEAGDYFGERVVVINTNPTAEASPQTLLVAVGSPGEDLSGSDTGEIRVLPAAEATISADTTVYRKAGGLPGVPIVLELIGFSLSATSQYLYVGTPYGDAAVYAIPWSSLAAGTAAPSHAWRPGVAGIPAGEVAFGATVR